MLQLVEGLHSCVAPCLGAMNLLPCAPVIDNGCLYMCVYLTRFVCKKGAWFPARRPFSGVYSSILLSARLCSGVDEDVTRSPTCCKCSNASCVPLADLCEQLITGHKEGSMTVWQGLYERIGAAFGVSGFEDAGCQPSSNMHWHANAVQCMAIATDG